jgi:hypothetical protein
VTGAREKGGRRGGKLDGREGGRGGGKREREDGCRARGDTLWSPVIIFTSTPSALASAIVCAARPGSSPIASFVRTHARTNACLHARTNAIGLCACVCARVRACGRAHMHSWVISRREPPHECMGAHARTHARSPRVQAELSAGIAQIYLRKASVILHIYAGCTIQDHGLYSNRKRNATFHRVPAWCLGGAERGRSGHAPCTRYKASPDLTEEAQRHRAHTTRLLGVRAGRVKEGEDAQHAPRPLLPVLAPHRQRAHPARAQLMHLPSTAEDGRS